MKTKILGTTNEIEIPKVFESDIREDIVKKVSDALFSKQYYTVFPLAGRQSSKHKQSHARRKFKTLYGKGISRVPRKALWRRGDQFYWVGVYNPGIRGGRAPHAPKGFRRPRYINKKEKILALKSCLAATASKDILQKNYPSLKISSFPLIIQSQIIDKKTKEIEKFLENEKLDIKADKKVRAGIGKVRGRKYKNTRKIILILSDKEKSKIQRLKGLNVKVTNTSQLNVKELSLNGKPGKLAVYTENAIKDLEKFN